MSNTENSALRACIQKLLASQLVGVMATSQPGEPAAVPYTSLMAFAHSADLRYLVIATLRASQKHSNLLKNSAINMLIDNRGNSAQDYQHAVAVSVIGRAEAMPEAELATMHALFSGKHPALHGFIALPDCALLRIAVQCYRVVDEFQRTQVLEINA